MKTIIKTTDLSKTFTTQIKQQGVKASVKAFFKREYKEVTAVENISMQVNQGEIIGFIGPNGAGKTTTLKMLSGLLYPTSGTIDVLGYLPQQRKNSFLKQISLVMGQKNQLWWDLPAIETFKLNQEIYEIPQKVYEQRLEELTKMLGAENLLHTQVRKLSLGQRMKCELIAALLHQPKVLFLDEPTLGLDIVTQKNLRQFIKEYNHRHQATILLTSHYMDDVKEICERVIMINHGKIVFDGKLSELISKYADYKTITIILSEEVSKQRFSAIQDFQITTTEKYKLIGMVDREKTATVASQLLNDLPVDDLDIAEPRLEDILQESFNE